MDWFQLVQHGDLLRRASVAAAAPRAPMLVQHPMSHARVVFLAVLVVFFCALFIGSYVWMRRPKFGQLGGGDRPRPSGTGVPAAGADRSEGPG
jgi:hypothetical protein